MFLMNIVALMIFSVMLMAVLLIPLLHAVGAYDEKRKAGGRREKKYSVLFDTDEQPRFRG